MAGPNNAPGQPTGDQEAVALLAQQTEEITESPEKLQLPIELIRENTRTDLHVNNAAAIIAETPDYYGT